MTLVLPQARPRDSCPPSERRELPIAVAEIEDDRQRVVLLRVRDQEVEQEALAAAGGAEDERVADVLDVQIEAVRRLVRRLEDASASRRRCGLTRLAADRA